MTHVILVHGTFDRDAPWTLPGSALRKHLKDFIPGKVRIKSIPWSGANTIKARTDAAKCIAMHVRAIKLKYGDAPIFLVGQSHGGSAISYFLKSDVGRTADITGCVFMSTPFLSAKSRRAVPRRLMLAHDFSVVAFNVIVSAMILAAAYVLALDDNVFYPLAAVNIVTFAIMVRRYISVPNARSHLRNGSRKVAEHARKIETCDLPDCNKLFVVVPGDEAAMGLNFSQSFAWGINRLLERMFVLSVRTVRQIERSKLIGRSFLSYLALVIAFAWLVLFPIVAPYVVAPSKIDALKEQIITQRRIEILEKIKTLESNRWGYLEAFTDLISFEEACDGGHEDPRLDEACPRVRDKVNAEAAKYDARVDGLRDELKSGRYRIVLTELGYLVNFFSYLILFFSAALLLVSFLFAFIIVSLWTFGDSGTMKLLFMEYSIESAPYGRNEVLHVSRSLLGKTFAGYIHNQPQVSEPVLRQIGTWIRDRLAEAPRGELATN